MKMVVLGAPGAGKGTQTNVLKKYFSVPAISAGAIIRDIIKSKTPIGIKIQNYILHGRLVPDEIMIDVVMNRIKDSDCANGFILDGFPRTRPQACALDEYGVYVDCVLSIEVIDEDILDRLDGRSTCPKCGLTYHREYNPSRNDGVCDICKTTLVVRDDDNRNTIVDRLKVFHNVTEPLKDYYRERGILKVVFGKKDIVDTTREVFKVLGLELT